MIYDDLVVTGPVCDMPETEPPSMDRDNRLADETGAEWPVGYPEYSWCGEICALRGTSSDVVVLDHYPFQDECILGAGGWIWDAGVEPSYIPASSSVLPPYGSQLERPMPSWDSNTDKESAPMTTSYNTNWSGRRWTRRGDQSWSPSSIHTVEDGLDEVKGPPTTERSCPFCEGKAGRGFERIRDFHRHHRHRPWQSYIRRVATRAGDCASVVAGGLATVVVLNFNQSLGQCPALQEDHRWPMVLPLLKHLPASLRCPSSSLYMIAILLYSAAGVFQVVREPRYWADCALVAVLLSLAVGAVYGVRPMVDALIVGGLLSLVCCKALFVWSA